MKPCIANHPGIAEIKDAIQDQCDGEDSDHEQCEDQDHAKDFEIEDTDEAIPQDLDGWHWAFSDDESDEEHPGDDDKDGKHTSIKADDQNEMEASDAPHGASGVHRVRVAELRPEYIECRDDMLLVKPVGATLGVHPVSRTWRGSYPGSMHYGRTWGSTRSAKKALLEVMKLILEDHLKQMKGDKLVKAQLARVTKAWTEA